MRSRGPGDKMPTRGANGLASAAIERRGSIPMLLIFGLATGSAACGLVGARGGAAVTPDAAFRQRDGDYFATHTRS